MALRERPAILPAPEQPRRVRAPTQAQIDASAPWLPASYERADVVAWQALQAGTADAEQQKRCLRWLLEDLTGTYDQTFHPGRDGARNSDFAAGKRSIGLQVVKLLHLNPGRVPASNPHAKPYEPKA